MSAEMGEITREPSTADGMSAETGEITRERSTADRVSAEIGEKKLKTTSNVSNSINHQSVFVSEVVRHRGR